MERTQGSSSSVSNSAFRGNSWYEVSNVKCNCNKPTVIFKSWTNENPGRRFLKCGGKVSGLNVSCEFWKWFDEEPPHGWQKVSLIEARDQIRLQKEELKVLKEEMKFYKSGNDVGAADRTERTEKMEKFEEAKRALETEAMALKEREVQMGEMMKKFEEERRSLQFEAMASKEREKLLRKFVVLSWGGFVVVTGLVLHMVNKA